MNINYYVVNPTENITILVETPVARELQPFVASELLNIEKRGEQVGFIDNNASFDISVRMAGGEFCGNASIAAAALFLTKNSFKASVSVCLSGTPVTVTAENLECTEFKYSVHLKNYAEISEISFDSDNKKIILPMVRVFGISHIIADASNLYFDPERVIKGICKKIDADALGIMTFDSNTNWLRPLVYVPDGDSLYWENSCASGTMALGAYLSNKTGCDIALTVHEPGGDLKIEASESDLILLGNAVVEYKKQVNI